MGCKRQVCEFFASFGKDFQNYIRLVRFLEASLGSPSINQWEGKYIISVFISNSNIFNTIFEKY